MHIDNASDSHPNNNREKDVFNLCVFLTFTPRQQLTILNSSFACRIDLYLLLYITFTCVILKLLLHDVKLAIKRETGKNKFQ